MKILFTAEYDAKMTDQIMELGEVRMEGFATGLPTKLSEDALKKMAADADIIITSYDNITRGVIDAASKLKLIACTRATPVNIDCGYAAEKGIPVLYTPGRNSDSAAELTIGLMLGCARHIPQAYKALLDGKFLAPEKRDHKTMAGLREDVIWEVSDASPYMIYKGIDLKNKTLGIVGFGSIGKRVAHIAQAFGMYILLYDPYVSEVDVNGVGQRKADLDTLLKNADFVSCHLKVTPETRGLMSAEKFALMKPTAYFINSSRAAVVDEEALIAALRENRIAGAGLDVFASEPMRADHPFLRELADRVVMTPHIGGATTDAITNHTAMIIADIKRFFAGEHLLYAYRG
jgi:D-3-phosphoglycerate dehydrogenase